MRKDLNPMPAVFPMPVLIVAAYDENGVPDALNAAWGMTCTQDKIALFINANHKTTKNIRASKAFTVSIADAAHVEAADYLGIVSGNAVPDKFERSGLTHVKSEHVNAPIIPEFPLAMECELVEETTTESGVHMIIGKLVNISVDEKILDDESGKIEAEQMGAILFDQYQWTYFDIGSRVANAASVGKGLKQ